MKHKTDAHSAIMQGNAPEPAVGNSTVGDSSLGREGHPASTRPVSPNSHVLECIVIVPILQVVHGHHPGPAGSINQVVES